MSENLLSTTTSPYLLQHADNPVHWQPWGDAAFEQARRDNKPILLSIGYAACHWCHVMAHESFEDQDTADIMNELYINIKVDREEHPDVDHIYQKALSIIGQQGGWPLTMFLTPDGQPFWGGTYFPNRAAYGQPSFQDVLESISNIFHTQKENVEKNMSAIADALDEESKPKGNGSLQLSHIKDTVGYIHQNIDPINGGLKGAPKFPQPVLLEFLWHAGWIKQDIHLQNLLQLSLEKMCQGGIYDHLGGGFARYSTDEEWLAPHFEKMLYDNALLISLLTKIWRKHPLSLFKQTVEETISWVFAEMTIQTPNGLAITSALDADSEGEEGKFYVWSEEEIDNVLGKNSKYFKTAFDITTYGNWEGKNIIRRMGEFSVAKDETRLKTMRQKLYEKRKERVAPGRDDKVLTDWNAMLIKGLCEAGLAFENEDWIKKAKDLFTSLLNLMENDDKLHHSWCDGRIGPVAYLEDYANLCTAALALYEVTGQQDYLIKTKDWVDHLNLTFWDPDVGGYNFASMQTVDGLAIHPKPVHDNATPSGNGLMANVLCDLYQLTGELIYQERFDQLINTFGSSNPNEIFGMPGLCNALIRFAKMETIAIIGPADSIDTKDLIKKASLSPSPHRKILLGDGNTALDPAHPLFGKKMIDDKPTAYVCQLGRCSAPVTDPDELENLLNNLPI
ncbi:MAG: thioredoxin domain-containing protein [Methylocystaceae bacterium]|nr:thioredoxin domain-containing protein [Methylocystaceae bacterium]